MRTRNDLLQMQSLPLDLKIRLTEQRIRQWVDEFGENGVFVSFSGGKDSTVLLHLVRQQFPSVPGVFVNTGLEYPEIVNFVKTFENVEIIKPKMNFKKVVETYGYPFPSKEAAECIAGARRYLDELRKKVNSNTISLDEADEESMENPTKGAADSKYRKLRGLGEFSKEAKIAIENSEEFARMLEEGRQSKSGGANYRLARMLGMLSNDNTIVPADKLHGRQRSQFSQTKWKFFLEEGAPRVSNRCCNVMKKAPAHEYMHRTGRKPMIATLATESRLRQQAWIRHGCNGFDMEIPTSTPMAFWTEQDVLKYIKKNNIKIASVYGDIVADEGNNDLPEGQLCFTSDEHILTGKEFGEAIEAECNYKTTGCNRTGCVFCGFGCHMEAPGEGRFVRLKRTHPKLYEWIMKPWEEGGLDYKHVIDWINEHGGTNIEY